MAKEPTIETDLRDRILDGTLRAIGQHGLRKLGMTDVAAAAGVSRGTLYRYFGSRDELLGALFDFERQRFQGAVNDRLADIEPGLPRLEAHIEFVLEYLRGHPALARLVETEPRYGLNFLDTHSTSFRSATAAILEPILADSEHELAALGLRLDTLADLLYRILLSFFLFRPTEAAESESLSALTQIMRTIAAAPARSGR